MLAERENLRRVQVGDHRVDGHPVVVVEADLPAHPEVHLGHPERVPLAELVRLGQRLPDELRGMRQPAGHPQHRSTILGFQSVIHRSNISNRLYTRKGI